MAGETVQKYIYAEGCSEKEMLVLAADTCRQLNWITSSVSPGQLDAFTHSPSLSWACRIEISIQKDKLTITCSGVSPAGFTWGREKKYLDQFVSTYAKQKRQATFGSLENRYSEIVKTALIQQESGHPNADNLLESFSPDEKSKVRPESTPGKVHSPGFLTIFFLHYRVTPWILIILLAVPTLMWAEGLRFYPFSTELMEMGASNRLMTMNNECWRLFSSLFIPSDPWQWGLNLLAIVFAGMILEPSIGLVRMLLVMITAGTSTAVMGLVLYSDRVFSGITPFALGLWGAVLVLRFATDAVATRSLKLGLPSMLITIVFQVRFMEFISASPSMMLTGFGAGVISMLLILPSVKSNEDFTLQIATPPLVLVFYAMLLWMIWFSIPKDLIRYREIHNEIAINQKLAEAAYQKALGTEGRQKLILMKGEVIRNWNKNIRLVNESRKLNLPDSLLEKNNYLLQLYILKSNRTRLEINQTEKGVENFEQKIERFDERIKKVEQELVPTGEPEV
ncbi:MAG TPA: rhomboid family intramembrane serine protease [Catalimonadaceae bacterium]|nr:rhomboid family intramembrane serine protease [Catalimonadaceae bacterium]